MSDTPETDAEIENRGICETNQYLHCSFARTLERSRDSALAELARVKADFERKRSECWELSQERDQLRADLAAAREETKADIASLLSVACTTVPQLRQRYLDALNKLNQKDKPAGFESWEEYHKHVAATFKENAALAARADAAERERVSDRKALWDVCARLEWAIQFFEGLTKYKVDYSKAPWDNFDEWLPIAKKQLEEARAHIEQREEKQL